MSEFINNNTLRQQKLKELIKSLHDGKTVDDVKDEFAKHFGDVSTQEISAIEQDLVKEGLPIEEVQRLCDVHASVFKGSISDIHRSAGLVETKGHPLFNFTKENRAIETLIAEEILPSLTQYTQKKDNNSYLNLRIGMDRLLEIDRHYARKEYLFFPYLEKKGITAPPKVMWGVDDEIRNAIKEVIALLSTVDPNITLLTQKVQDTTKQVLDMIFKEENILLPLLEETLNLYNWIKIAESQDEFGFTLITPDRTWSANPNEEIEETPSMEDAFIGQMQFDAGFLSSLETNAILNTLPLDITFVDKDDKVKYFSSGPERIFDRPKTIIGRDVAMCHPPKSVHIVEKIMDSFKDGTKDKEEFWIQFKGAFIHIRYYAIRDRDKNYLGTLEVTQNIQPLRNLEGEKRLLEDE